MNKLDSTRLPACDMARIVVHWTAGTHKASALDREHYHILIEGDGTIVYGNHPIDANAKPAREPRASHTRNLNTGSIGISVCCMKDAKERPFSAGPFPLTIQQWQVAAEVVAELCARYRIAVTPRTVLAHGEVENTLNVPQLQKWDPLVLPWLPGQPRQQVMDEFRATAQQHLTQAAPPPPPPGGGAPVFGAPAPPQSGGGFTPQSITWRGDQAVLLVHGVGNAKPGDYTDVEREVQNAAGPDVAVYSLFYDVFNDWINAKAQFASKLQRLTTFITQKEGEGELQDAMADFIGDVLWPVFWDASRALVQRAYIAQMQQIVLDANAHGVLKREMKVSIVCHSLGCFHTYEMLHEIARNPAHALQPATDSFTFRSVVFMASPVQLIRTVAQQIGGLVPSGLATVDAALGLTSETVLGVARPQVGKCVSVAGDLDPIGGHFLRRQADWAYMNLPGQTPIIVNQRLAAGDEATNLFTRLRLSVSNGKPPSLNNPHSWVDYVTGPQMDFKTWFA